VDKVETGLLEKIGKDLLKNKQPIEQRSQEAELKKLKFFFERDIIPRPDAALYRSRPSPLVVGLRINLKQVTYACLNAGQGRLDKWDVLPVFENANSLAHFHHHNLEKTAKSLGELRSEYRVPNY
jgi:hypothetical protein